MTIKETADQKVSHVRINYKSGAYIQAWFKSFSAERYDSGIIRRVKYRLPDVPEDAKNDLCRPMHIGTDDIESIWVMSTMDAEEFYNKLNKI